jgi:hypothetical protein
MATLALYVALLPPILKQKFPDAFWISSANNILEILSSEGILRELTYQKGVIVKYQKWITPPGNYRQAKKVFSPTDWNSEFPFIEDDGKLMLTNQTVDEDPAPVSPFAFSNSAVGSITVQSMNPGATSNPMDILQSVATGQNWQGIAMSSDGTIQTAVVFSGYIWVSTDSGATWTQKATSLNWYGIAMSSDGTIQTAVVYGGYIWVSTDSGATWTQKATSLNWRGIAMSSDGTIQTAGVYGGYIRVSNSTAFSQDDLKDHLFVITGGTKAGNTFVIAGNDATIGRSTKIYYLHVLSTALAIGSEITAAIVVSPDNYIMLSYRGSFVEIAATSDEIPINNNHEHQIMRSGLSMLGFEQLPSGPNNPIAKDWRAYFERVLMKIRDEFLSGGNQTDVKSRRWIGMMDDDEIDTFPDEDDT